MPKKRPTPSPELRHLAGQTTLALATALRDAGLSRAELQEAFGAACSPNPAIPAPDDTHIDSAQLGTALALWHRDRRFTDPDTGLPVPLTRAGRSRSLDALIRAAGIKSNRETWLKFFVTSGLVRPVSRTSYMPRGRSARMPSMNALQIEHVALGVYHLVRTALKNYTKAGVRRPLLQSATVVRSFPTARKEQFRQFVNAQGDAFLANVDDYLESRAQHAPRSKPGAGPRKRAGVYAFAFIE